MPVFRLSVIPNDEKIAEAAVTADGVLKNYKIVLSPSAATENALAFALSESEKAKEEIKESSPQWFVCFADGTDGGAGLSGIPDAFCALGYRVYPHIYDFAQEGESAVKKLITVGVRRDLPFVFRQVAGTVGYRQIFEAVLRTFSGLGYKTAKQNIPDRFNVKLISRFFS